MTDAMPHAHAPDPGSMDCDAICARNHEKANMSVGELTRLLHIDCPDEPRLARTTFALRRVRDGESLVHAGDEFHSLYVVRSGCFKTVYTDLSGSEQVLGFPMAGDVIGADGIDSGHYASAAISLDTSEVAIVPLTSLARQLREFPQLSALLYRVISRELVRVQNMAWTLGTLGAEGRVAAFLLELSARLGALGYSRSSFNLRMRREEIGNYLGLKLETVSRALSALNTSGLVQVHQRSVDIVDADALLNVIASNAGIVSSIAPKRGVANGKRPGNSLLRSQPGSAWQQLAAA